MGNNEVQNEIDDIKKWEDKIKRKNLKYKTNKYDFQRFETIKSFGDNIYFGKINIDEAKMDQSNLLENIVEFNNKSRLREKKGKDKKRNTFDSVNAVQEGRKLTLNAFKSGIFPIKTTQRKGLKILTPKQMLQRLSIALALVKGGNTFENLLNEIGQIYSLFQEK